MAIPGGATSVPVVVGPIDLWSGFATVTITAVATTKALPSITIVGIPGGVTRAVIIVKFRAISEHLGSDTQLQGDQQIQVRNALGGSWLTSMTVLNGQLICLASAREYGDALIGNGDIKAQVPDSGTVELQWLNSRVSAGSELRLEDLQTGVRVWFSG
jgi:hypothetical protein